MKKNNFLSLNAFLKMFFGASLCFIMATSSIMAQDNSVSDEDLRKYAVVMDSIDAMKENIQTEYNALIQEEELMQGGRRFVEIQQIGEDSVRLTEMNVTEMELEAFQKIQERYAEMTSEFKENYTSLIKEDLGAALYNKVTKAIKEDSEVKSRYENILEEVKSQGNGDDESGQLGQPGEQGQSDDAGSFNDTDNTDQVDGLTSPEGEGSDQTGLGEEGTGSAEGL